MKQSREKVSQILLRARGGYVQGSFRQSVDKCANHACSPHNRAVSGPYFVRQLVQENNLLV